MTRPVVHDYSQRNKNSHGSPAADAVSSQPTYWDDDEWDRANSVDETAALEIEILASDVDHSDVESFDVDESQSEIATDESTPEFAESETNLADSFEVDPLPVEHDLSQSGQNDSRDCLEYESSESMDSIDEPLDVIIDTEDSDAVRPVQYDRLVARWIAGLVASLVLHLWVVSTLSSIMIVKPEYEREFAIDSKIEFEEIEPIPVPVETHKEFELANPDDVEKEQQTALNARSVGLILSEKPVQEAAPPIDIDERFLIASTAPVFDIPEGMEVNDTIVVQGTTGEGVVQLDAALDRVSWEIAANLKQRKVLVVWLLDSSGSLTEQRKVVANRMRRIYSELNALETAGQIPNQDQPLLSAVVTFGQGVEFLTQTPTPKVDEIIAQLDKVPMDQSGIENVFGAVRKVIDKWSSLRRRMLVIAVTDEAGDDFGQHLNLAINALNRTGGRAYVIGPPAVFGKRQGFVPYLAPENGQTYQIPVDIGPESAMGENVQLPFWFNGPQYENLSSGLGPYALARLVHETGGVYFMTNMTTAAGLTPTGSYAAQTMKLFAPDYRFGSTDDYLRDVSKHPIRAAVHRAHELSLKYKALGTPTLEMRVNPNNYIQTLATAQQTVAVSTAMIDEILTAFPPSLEQEYLKEESPRWRMAYNLSFGRLLAQRLRCMEYNTALAQLKLLGTQEIASKVNHFVFRPDPSINYAAGMKKPKELSERLLKRCVAEAPGTPWAIMAERELQHPFGIKVIQKYDPPPPTPSEMPTKNVATKKKGILLLADDTKKKKQAPPPAPPPPPKLPKF